MKIEWDQWHDARTEQPDAEIAVLAYTSRGHRLVTYDGRYWHDYQTPLVIILDVKFWTDLPEEPEEM